MIRLLSVCMLLIPQLSTAATITWVHDGANVDQFIIYASDSTKQSSEKLSTVDKAARSFEVDTPCGTSFFIFACNKSECSDPSIVVYQKCPTPAAPVLSIK